MRLEILTNSGAVPVTDPEQGAPLTDLIPVQVQVQVQVQVPDYAGSNLILARDTYKDLILLLRNLQSQ